ncbi:MAG: HDOD domain-containing protein [Pseudomonadota bacterium]|jgi:putative nucleotidyltransferase with HDIG domain|uniref:HDOD domain protein n=1 Tax=anaerobic digester metagenome TaxID=1263854 RepID=A0A485M258_9ZZZZ|nr:HDOD domain-containing protein [Pseudomonadota bacterium]HPX17893.1 HDOD domain-containing protein [Deltaproteobacteria bacterium]HRS55944.1 HDOD domain-containing protein [Desulfomonilia bacterium]
MTVKNTKAQFCVEKRFETIPALDATRARLFEVLQRDDADIERVERIISTDPAVAAKVMKLANSPFYRHTRKHLGLHQSLLTIGLDMVKCISLSMTVMDTLKCETRYARDLWAHSYAAAVIAISLSVSKAEKDRLFTGALLHDLGRMIFLFLAPEVYTALIDSERCRPGEELERQTFSLSHTELGKTVAMKWNFPQEIVEIISSHHRPVNHDSALVCLINHVICQCEREIPEADPSCLGIVRPFLGDTLKDLVNIIAQRYKTNTAMIESLF